MTLFHNYLLHPTTETYSSGVQCSGRQGSKCIRVLLQAFLSPPPARRQAPGDGEVRENSRDRAERLERRTVLPCLVMCVHILCAIKFFVYIIVKFPLAARTPPPIYLRQILAIDDHDHHSMTLFYFPC